MIAKRRPPAPIAADPIAGARSFLDTQTAAMRTWDNSALPSRKEHEIALAYIAALLERIAQGWQERLDL